jgi:hypothetical protein
MDDVLICLKGESSSFDKLLHGYELYIPWVNYL